MPHGWNILDNAKNVLTKALNKYCDFFDIFDKLGVDFLSEHNKYDMAIEFEAEKMSLIGYIYDLLHMKLEVLKEYIDKMFAKGFIVSLKLFITALVLFSKK